MSNPHSVLYITTVYEHTVCLYALIIVLTFCAMTKRIRLLINTSCTHQRQISVPWILKEQDSDKAVQRNEYVFSIHQTAMYNTMQVCRTNPDPTSLYKVVQHIET